MLSLKIKLTFMYCTYILVEIPRHADVVDLEADSAS